MFKKTFKITLHIVDKIHMKMEKNIRINMDMIFFLKVLLKLDKIFKKYVIILIKNKIVI